MIPHEEGALLGRIRVLIAIVIAGLIVSGISALPLLPEVTTLHEWVHGWGFQTFRCLD
jgi:hypothetical protein